jgi:hypothetical protein
MMQVVAFLEIRTFSRLGEYGFQVMQKLVEISFLLVIFVKCKET